MNNDSPNFNVETSFDVPDVYALIERSRILNELAADILEDMRANSRRLQEAMEFNDKLLKMLDLDSSAPDAHVIH